MRNKIPHTMLASVAIPHAGFPRKHVIVSSFVCFHNLSPSGFSAKLDGCHICSLCFHWNVLQILLCLQVVWSTIIELDVKEELTNDHGFRRFVPESQIKNTVCIVCFHKHVFTYLYMHMIMFM